MSEQAWLSLNDDELTAVSLTAVLAERAQRTAETKGTLREQFPSFGGAMGGGETAVFPAAIQAQLAQLAAVPVPETESMLAPSPTTQMPLLGKLWGLIRAQMHELVLFYVNRLAGQSVRWQGHAEATLAELAAAVQAQQEEIDSLKQQLVEQANEEAD